LTTRCKDDDNQGREQTFAEADVEDLADAACPTCQGTRLNATAACDVQLRTASSGISRCGALVAVTDVRKWVQTPADRLGGMTKQREADIARDLIPEIKSRLEFLEEVGLGYLTLDRGAPTLSGGEAQRIRLAAQLGSNLQGVCYVLDEPTIGLHARDNKILLGALQQLERQGQHAGGGGARRRHHPPRRPHHRHWSERGQTRMAVWSAQGSVADVQAGLPRSQTGPLSVACDSGIL